MTTLPALLTTETLDRLAKEIQEHLDRGAELVRRGAEEWIAAGGKLAEARELCGHGEWAPWLKRHLPELTQQTALNYIRLFKRFGHMDDDKLKTVFNLPGEVLRMLASPDTPQDVVDSTLDRAAAGKQITVPLIKREINGTTPTRAEQKPEAANLDAKKATAKAAMPAYIACVDSVRSTVMTHARPLSRKDRARLFGDLRDTIDDIEADLAAST
jgi:hypothetical protein